MKTFLFGIDGKVALVEADSKAEAIDTLVWSYGFHRMEIIIYYEVDIEYIEKLGLDTY